MIQIKWHPAGCWHTLKKFHIVDPGKICANNVAGHTDDCRGLAGAHVVLMDGIDVAVEADLFISAAGAGYRYRIAQ